jgi:hypothetical protein
MSNIVNCKVKYIRPKYNNLEEWINDKNNVYIGRAGIVFINGERFPKKNSLFCNPFKIDKDGTREEVLQKFENYIQHKLTDPLFKQEFLKLKDKTLGCWCKPDKCHGDILIKLLNIY